MEAGWWGNWEHTTDDVDIRVEWFIAECKTTTERNQETMWEGKWLNLLCTETCEQHLQAGLCFFLLRLNLEKVNVQPVLGGGGLVEILWLPGKKKYANNLKKYRIVPEMGAFYIPGSSYGLWRFCAHYFCFNKRKKGELFIGGFNVPDSSPIASYVTKCLNGQSERLIWGIVKMSARHAMWSPYRKPLGAVNTYDSWLASQEKRKQHLVVWNPLHYQIKNTKHNLTAERVDGMVMQHEARRSHLVF